MLLDAYHDTDGDRVRISRRQASRFAKDVAGDFNPIHDVDARRFCVPGDLLCSLVLARYGVSSEMAFNFSDMVGDGVELIFPAEPGAEFDIRDSAGRVYLEVRRSGETCSDPALTAPFIRQYAAFSGTNFPHVLQPLLARHGVMFNPERPLIMYRGMGFSLDDLADGDLTTELSDADLEADARRARVRLAFVIRRGDRVAGRGSKELVISGLRPYDGERMHAVMDVFEDRRRAYLEGR